MVRKVFHEDIYATQKQIFSLKDFVAAEQSIFSIRFRATGNGWDHSFNAINEVIGEELIIQRRNESFKVCQWFIGRIPVECPNYVDEVIKNIGDSMESLPFVEIFC